MQKQAESAPTTVAFDRRQVYRPFLESLNAVAPSRDVFARDLIIPRVHDPHDLHQPPIYEALAQTAELNRGAQMALVGGIG